MKRPILFCEDDSSIVQVVTQILEMNGQVVITAATEKKVLDLAKTQNPFLILLDISLSGSDGRNIAKKLKTVDETKNTPIVIVSADANIKQIAKESGVDGYLVKPFDIEMLLEIVKQYSSK